MREGHDRLLFLHREPMWPDDEEADEGGREHPTHGGLEEGIVAHRPMLSFDPERPWEEEDVSAKPFVLEFGMGVDVHGGDCTTAACRAVSDAIRHSSLPFFTDVRKRGGRMLVDVTVGVPDPASVDVERVRRELPHGEVTVRAQTGGLRVPGFDTLIACVAITVSVDAPS